MTVEQLIELLQEQYPQALVYAENAGPDPIISAYPPDDCSVLEPYDVRTERRSGAVYIVCEHHDC